MSERRALIEWKNGQEAELSAGGWRVNPPDELLAQMLNERYGLAAMQARRATTIPDLLATAARAAANATGAELVHCDPPRAIAERSSEGRV